MRIRTTVAFGAMLAALAMAPAAQAKGTAYVVGSGSNTVAAHSIGPAGGLTAVGGPVATGQTPRSVVVTPDALFAYVSIVGSDNISVFSVGQNGALTPVTTVSTGANTDPFGMAITPNGVFLYAANQGSNEIAGFTIAANGNLVPVPGSPFAAAQIKNVAISPDGLHLYASTGTGVRAYDIAQDTGALTANGGVIAAGTAPEGIVTSPDNLFVYVGNTGSDNINGYSIGPSGSLTPIGTFATGDVPRTLAITPDGRFLYSANFGVGDNVSGFAIGSGGALSPAPNSPYPAGTQPFGVDAAPNSANVYVTNFNNNLASSVFAYSIAGDGALSSLSGSPFASGVNGSEYQSIAITPNQGPNALFTATPQGAGNPTLFSAVASSDPDGGGIAAYQWDFGDGTSETTTTPEVSHTYENAGDYQVTLTLTDNEGCSDRTLFTGQTADCNGANGRQTQTVPITQTDTAPNLKLKGKKQELAKKVTVTAKTADDTEAVAKGKIRIEPKGGKAKSYDLKKAKKDLDAGEKTKLKPKLSDKVYDKAKKALKNKGDVSAKVNVKVTDEDDDTDKDSVKVKLTKP